MTSLKLRNQAGFSIFELILVIAVLAILAVLSLRFMDDRSKPEATSKQASTTAVSKDSGSSVPSAPAINKTSDLSAAEAALDQADPANSNSADSSQLDAQLSASN
jgi:prepilin-type N-terminal cleavage/methylation domain-containing protein